VSTPFVGEIRIFGFSRTPVGWLACNGAAVSISTYEVLFTLIGTTFGGDGRSNFCVPDLRGRAPIHQGTGANLTPRVLGASGGSESVTILLDQLPSHTHTMYASTGAAQTPTPGSGYVLAAPDDELYLDNVSGLVPSVLDPRSSSLAGGNQPHDNMMPSLTAQYCIAWNGLFPSRA
jgi:microcystin-dependent protein